MNSPAFANVKHWPSLDPAARVTGTATGTTVDLLAATGTLGDTPIEVPPWDTVVVSIYEGAYTNGTHTWSIEDSVNGTTFAKCTGGTQISAEAPITTAAHIGITSIIYYGRKQYIRVKNTVTNAVNGELCAAWVDCFGAKYQGVISGQQ